MDGRELESKNRTRIKIKRHHTDYTRWYDSLKRKEPTEKIW